MKLNLGAGDRYVHGWHNVDHGSPHRMDEARDLLDFAEPYPWHDVEACFMGHLLEHLPFEACPLVLDRVRHCCKPGAMLLVVGPDMNKARAMADTEGNVSPWHTLTNLRYGEGRWAGDVHLWESTTERIVELLLGASWTWVHPLDLNDVGPEWPIADRSQRWQAVVSAVAP